MELWPENPKMSKYDLLNSQEVALRAKLKKAEFRENQEQIKKRQFDLAAQQKGINRFISRHRYSLSQA